MGGLWTLGAVMEHRSDDFHGRNCKMSVTNTAHINRTRRCVKTSPIITEGYLRNEVLKKDTMQGADRLNELVYHFMK